MPAVEEQHTVKSMLPRYRSWILLALLALGPGKGWARGEAGQAQERGSGARQTDSVRAASDLVRVNIFTEVRVGVERLVLQDGQVPLKDSPIRVIRVVPATGLVIDQRNHVLSFLGYRWPDICQEKRSVEIITAKGDRHSGKLVGIDQSTGVAVIHVFGDRLRKTPVCHDCRVHDGTTVVVPVHGKRGTHRFESAKILSIAYDQPHSAAWEVTTDLDLSGAGQPLLDKEHRVLGFVSRVSTSGQSSRKQPGGLSTVVYPVSQLLRSAERVLRSGGDIRTGWLGVYLGPAEAGSGILITDVIDRGPADLAGLRGQDVLIGWNGIKLNDRFELIRRVQNATAGSSVRLRVLRKGKVREMTARIETRPQDFSRRPYTRIESLGRPDPQSLDPQVEKVGPGYPQGSGVGIETYRNNPQFARVLDIPEHRGLIVARVSEQSLGARNGILAGDVIVEVDGRPVNDPEAFHRYAASARPNGVLTLTIYRKGQQHPIGILLKKR